MPSTGANVVLYSDISAKCPTYFFLDANVVLDLFEHEQAMKMPKPEDKRRGKKHPNLFGWLSRMRASKTQLIVTPDDLEEVFHVLCSKLLRKLAKSTAYS